MTRVTIYHNPRCSKSRSTLALLEERGEDVQVVKYLEDVPSVEALDTVCRALGVEPTAIVRSREARFAELGLSLDDERSRAGWLAILHENPVLIERPIVVRGKRAAIGRPPENVLQLF